MDLGDMTSKELGELTSKGLVSLGKKILEEQEGEVPGTLKNQNLGHNSKKEGLGPNTRRQASQFAYCTRISKGGRRIHENECDVPFFSIPFMEGAGPSGPDQ